MREILFSLGNEPSPVLRDATHKVTSLHDKVEERPHFSVSLKKCVPRSVKTREKRTSLGPHKKSSPPRYLGGKETLPSRRMVYRPFRKDSWGRGRLSMCTPSSKRKKGMIVHPNHVIANRSMICEAFAS